MSEPQKKELTRKQSMFVAEYVKDWNGTQAAIRAGYSPKTANEQAARMLAKDSIKAAVEDKKAKVEDKALVDAAYVLNGLKEVARRCMEKEGFHPMGATRAFELLGKHKGLFKEEDKGGQTIVNIHLAITKVLQEIGNEPRT